MRRRTGRAGVWLTSARMHKLRTPKNLPVLSSDCPGLSFQAWYEARYGAAAYDALDRIPRLDWAAYLDWYRKLTGVPVRYGTRLVRIEPAGDHLRLHLEKGGGDQGRDHEEAHSGKRLCRQWRRLCA